MSDWNPEKYLLFKKQRTQPAVDLARRMLDFQPRTIVDIGCGPGNSTAVLKRVFPDARLIGIDSSEGMIAKARNSYGDIEFSVCRAEELTGSYDLLFSNACLQWIPDHEALIPKLMARLNPGGALAVQLPMNQAEPLYSIISRVAADPKWDFCGAHFEKNDVLSPAEYYDILSRCTDSFEMWETVYYHALPSHEHLLEWVRSTRLRPYLDALDAAGAREFEAEILCASKAAYTPAGSGEVIFKFRRFFFIARK